MPVKPEEAFLAACKLVEYLKAHGKPAKSPRALVEMCEPTRRTIREVLTLAAELTDLCALRALHRQARTLAAYHGLPLPRLRIAVIQEFCGDGLLAAALPAKRPPAPSLRARAAAQYDWPDRRPTTPLFAAEG